MICIFIKTNIKSNNVLVEVTGNITGNKRTNPNEETADGIYYDEINVKDISLYKNEESSERVFADAKEKHGMRYTQYRGLAKVKMELNLLFACMNLKELANWLDRKGPNRTYILSLFTNICKFSLRNTFLSRKRAKCYCI